MKANLFTSVSKTAVLASLLFSNLMFSQKGYEFQLNTLFKTFITKDFQLLEPIILKQEIDFLQNPGLSTKSLMVQQICLVPSPESYAVLRSETIGYNERLTVQYQYADKLRTHHFTFDRKRRLIAVEVGKTVVRQKVEEENLL